MAKKDKVKIPKRVLGFKLRKGTRKDLRKLLNLLESPQTKALAMSAVGGIGAFLAEHFAEEKLTQFEKRGRKLLHLN
jgi:hypothetical protein